MIRNCCSIDGSSRQEARLPPSAFNGPSEVLNTIGQFGGAARSSVATTIRHCLDTGNTPFGTSKATRFGAVRLPLDAGRVITDPWSGTNSISRRNRTSVASVVSAIVVVFPSRETPSRTICGRGAVPGDPHGCGVADGACAGTGSACAGTETANVSTTARIVRAITLRRRGYALGRRWIFRTFVPPAPTGIPLVMAIVSPGAAWPSETMRASAISISVSM